MAHNPEIPKSSQQPATPRMVSKDSLAALQDPSKPANPLISLGESLSSHLLNQNAHLSKPLEASMAAGDYESATEALGKVQTILEESRVMREKINEAIMGIHDTLGYLPDIRLSVLTQHGIPDAVLESASAAALPEGNPPAMDAAPVEQTASKSGEQDLSAEPLGFFVHEVPANQVVEAPRETRVMPPVQDLGDADNTIPLGSVAEELDLQSETTAVLGPEDESLPLLEQIRAVDAELAPPLPDLDMDMGDDSDAAELSAVQPTVEIQDDKPDTAGPDSLKADTQAVEASPAPEAEVIAEAVVQTASEVDDVQVEAPVDAKPEVSEASEPVLPADEVVDEEVRAGGAPQIAGLAASLQKVVDAYWEQGTTPGTRLEIAYKAWPDQVGKVADNILIARVNLYTGQIKPHLESVGLEIVALPREGRNPGQYYLKQNEGQTESSQPVQEPDQSSVAVNNDADKQPAIASSGAIIRTVSRDQISDRLAGKPSEAAPALETDSNPDQTPRIAGAGSKVQAIYSALWNSTEPISAPDLAEQIWPEVSDPSERIKRLNGQMFNLRKLAQAAGAPIKNTSKLGPGSVGRYIVEKPQTAATPAEKPEVAPVSAEKSEAAAPAAVVETAVVEVPATLPVSGELQFDATTVAAPAEKAQVQVEETPEAEKVIPNMSPADAWRIADMIEDLSIQEVERLQRNGVDFNLPNFLKSQIRQLHTQGRRKYESPGARHELQRTYNEWVEKMKQLVDNPTPTVLKYADKQEIQVALAAITFTIKTPEQLKALLNVHNL